MFLYKHKYYTITNIFVTKSFKPLFRGIKKEISRFRRKLYPNFYTNRASLPCLKQQRLRTTRECNMPERGYKARRWSPWADLASFRNAQRPFQYVSLSSDLSPTSRVIIPWKVPRQLWLIDRLQSRKRRDTFTTISFPSKWTMPRRCNFNYQTIFHSACTNVSIISNHNINARMLFILRRIPTAPFV